MYFLIFAWVAVMKTVQTETQTPTATHAGPVSFVLRGRCVGTDLCEADEDYGQLGAQDLTT